MANSTTLVFDGENVEIEHLVEPIGEQEQHENGNVHQRFRVRFKDLKNEQGDEIEVILIHDGERFILAL